MNPAFVLTCTTCDAGDEIDSMEAARAAGWERLYDDPTGVSWTAVGHCPECVAASRQREMF